MDDSPAECRRLLLWNRVWLGLLLLALAAWGISRVIENTDQKAGAVRCAWEGETLRFSALQGGVVVSYLVGDSQGRRVGARLTEPVFILDSGPARVPPSVWKMLEWRDDAGTLVAAPAVGSRISGLYTRLTWSD